MPHFEQRGAAGRAEGAPALAGGSAGRADGVVGGATSVAKTGASDVYVGIASRFSWGIITRSAGTGSRVVRPPVLMATGCDGRRPGDANGGDGAGRAALRRRERRGSSPEPGETRHLDDAIPTLGRPESCIQPLILLQFHYAIEESELTPRSTARIRQETGYEREDAGDVRLAWIHGVQRSDRK